MKQSKAFKRGDSPDYIWKRGNSVRVDDKEIKPATSKVVKIRDVTPIDDDNDNHARKLAEAVFDPSAGPFERLFSGIAIARMLDFLLRAQDWDYSETDIAKNSGVSTRTVQRELSKLIDSKLIRQTGTVGNAKMYQLNKPYKTALAAETFANALAQEKIRSKVKAAPKIKVRA